MFSTTDKHIYSVRCRGVSKFREAKASGFLTEKLVSLEQFLFPGFLCFKIDVRYHDAQ